MRFSLLLATAILVSLTSASKLTRCGTANPPEQLKFSLNQAALRHSIYRNGTMRTIDTYAHVVTTQQKEGTYTEQQVSDQVEISNIPAAIHGS